MLLPPTSSSHSAMLPPSRWLFSRDWMLPTWTHTTSTQRYRYMVILFSAKVFIIQCVGWQVSVTVCVEGGRTMDTSLICILQRELHVMHSAKTDFMRLHNFFCFSRNLARCLSVSSHAVVVVEIPYCNNNKNFIATLLQRRRVRRFVCWIFYKTGKAVVNYVESECQETSTFHRSFLLS